MKDKLSPADRGEIESALGELKTALSGSDTAAIKAKTEALTQVFYKVSEKLYQQPGAQPDAGPQAGPQGGPQGGGDGQQYYDADYTVVDDDKK